MQKFTKRKFNPSNMKQHTVNQHPDQWKKYISVSNAKVESLDAFKSFFDHSKLEAFFLKKDDVNGVTT